MFETLTDPDERGQIGIGTLIIFIAMVLVAAIAAGVLINTAGLLQTQAEDTGSETQEAIANQIEVVHSVGNVSDDNTVDVVNLTVKKSAGSEEIDLSSITIQYTSDNQDATLVHNSSDRVDTDDDTDQYFTTTEVGPNEDADDDSLVTTDERVRITMNVAAIEAGDPNAPAEDGLEGGTSVTLNLIDQSGAQFTTGLSIPQTFGDRDVVLV